MCLESKSESGSGKAAKDGLKLDEGLALYHQSCRLEVSHLYNNAPKCMS